MSTTLDLAAEHIAKQIASTIEPAIAMVDGWRSVLETELSGPFAGALTGTADADAETLDPVVEALVGAELERDGALITAAGFAAAPGYLADARWHLAWWLSSANTFGCSGEPVLRRLDTVGDPDSERFRDYTTLEWWCMPERTGRRHLAGPYVDSLRADDYTVTITTPVIADGEMIGVVGADADVARLERELLPVLREWSGSGILVNASGRVLASNDVRRATGTLLRLEGLAEALEANGTHATEAVLLPGGKLVVPCGDTTLALVAEAPSPVE